MKKVLRTPLKVLGLAEREASCSACLVVSMQPWLLSTGKTYCWRCVDELLGLGWAEWMEQGSSVVIGFDKAPRPRQSLHHVMDCPHNEIDLAS